MQESENEWQKQDKIYNFNAIFFFRNDATPWGQNFLISRINDPTWAPIFVDQYTIIFLKKTSQNQKIIDKSKHINGKLEVYGSVRTDW